jgi:flavorubredoxin
MVHWPESMVTYDASTGILFSSDAFGGFGAHEGGLFDDEKCSARWEDEMLRYFATIVGKYCSTTQAALKKLGGIEIKMICPAHGTLFRSDVHKVVSLYDRWSRYINEPGAMVVYGSMYGNTKRMAEAVCRGLVESGFTNTLLYDVARTNASYLLRDLWKMKGLIAVSCTYNCGLFPPMLDFFNKLADRKPKNHILGIAGSYSWSKGGLDVLRSFAGELGWDRVEPEPEIFASPTPEDLESCAQLGRNMAKKLQNGTA